jgi:hypothetical protein
MSVRAASPRVQQSVRRWTGLRPKAGADTTASLGFVVLTLAAALGSGYLLANGHTRIAGFIGFVPIAFWLITRPAVPLLLLAASIPITLSLTGGSDYGGGYEVAASDVLLVLIATGIVLERTGAKPTPVVAALRPVSVPVLQYCGVMVIILGAHLGFRDFLKTGQRFELFLIPMLVGAFAGFKDWHIRMLQAYVLSVTAVTVVWPFHHFGLGKNPTAGMMANAVVVVVGVPALRRFLPTLAILLPGLVFTQSRGAVAGGLVGVALTLLLSRSRSRTAVRRVFPAVIVATLAFVLAPASVQQRLQTLSAGNAGANGTRAQYSIAIRQQYTRDAHKIINAHRWVGVGVGNYFVSPTWGSETRDPHNVVLLQEAEGGYILGLSFLVLIGGVLLALFRIREIDVAPAAAGVLMATFAHGLVDVYWVRGTPVLGWLLVGMAFGVLARVRSEPAAPEPA